jgi:hypothetical protein
MINHIRDALTAVLNELFNGNADGLQILSKIIDGGAVFNPPATTAVDTMRNWEKVAYTFLIPQSWTVRGITPVIFPTGKACDDLEGALKSLDKFMSKEEADKGHACVGNQIYVLADPHGSSEECPPSSPNGVQFGLDMLKGKGCHARKFSLPENWDRFGPKFGDIKLADVVEA